MLPNVSKREVLFSLFAGFAFTAAPDYISTGDCSLDAAYVFSSLVLGMLFLLLGHLAEHFLEGWRAEAPAWIGRASSWVGRVLQGRHATLWLALIIFACWLPMLICLFPGTFINDTWGQIQNIMSWWRGKSDLSGRHPLLVSLIMYFVIVPFAKLTGHWHVAMFLYVLLQAAVTSLVFAYSVVYARTRLKVRNRWLLLALAMYCLLPFYATSVQTISKDAMFSWCYVLLAIFYMEVVRTEGEALGSARFLAGMACTVLFCCLTKKVAVYIIVGSLVLLLPFLRSGRGRVALQVAGVILLMFVAVPAFNLYVGMSSDLSTEKYSVLMQQTARYVKYHGDDITDEEYEAIDAFLNMDTLADRYNPTNVDPLKFDADTPAVWADDATVQAWLRVWAAQGLRHPETYADATFAMLSGWFSFTEYKPLMNMSWHNQQNAKLIPEGVADRTGVSAWLATFAESTYDRIANIPGVDVLLSYGLYASLVPLFLLAMLLKRRRVVPHCWLPMVPMWLSIVFGCWLAPVSISFEGRRYLYPVTYTIPLTLLWLCFVIQVCRKQATGKQQSAGRHMREPEA